MAEVRSEGEIDVPAVVIGAGVVGLAVARALAIAGVAPIIVERERGIGRHQSSRNSEVLHAGIYYPPGSLKARLCVDGRQRLLAYCRARQIPHRLCGKLIVATQAEQADALAALATRARACGVETLRPLTAAQARAREPNLVCREALLSPSTGIVDSHALLEALLADAVAHGATLALQTEVTRLQPDGASTRVHTQRAAPDPHRDPARSRAETTGAPSDPQCVRAPIVINAAAYGAQAIARTLPRSKVPPPARHLAKGTYFAVSGRPFNSLVYPVPASASLGIHVTVDMAGEVRFGPDQQWVPTVDYTLEPVPAPAFVRAVQAYFPTLNPQALAPGYVGVRNKVQAPGEPMADFVVHGPAEHGVAGLVNLYGIESPGLTACLALADEVLGRLGLPETPRSDRGSSPGGRRPGDRRHRADVEPRRPAPPGSGSGNAPATRLAAASIPCRATLKNPAPHRATGPAFSPRGNAGYAAAMRSRWSDADADKAVQRWADAPGSNGDVALRVYTSRLIGAEPALVLHGGGNTSVKTTLPDDTGAMTRVLCVKGSGWDLATLQPAGLPAVRLQSLQALRERESLSDEAMVNAARTRLLNASAPNPSVETLLHAFLPHTFIDHSHADAILTLVDQPGGAERCRELYGDRLAIVPYVMPGFALAKLAARQYEANPQCEGLVLLKHGLFTFGTTARESYERHIEAVSAAQARIANATGVSVPASGATLPSTPGGIDDQGPVPWSALAPMIRGRLDAGPPMFLHLRSTAAVRAFVDAPDLPRRAGRGPMTPDHVLRTKPWPMVLAVTDTARPRWPERIDEAIAAFRSRYTAYVQTQTQAKARTVTALDPDPRVILIPGLGLVGLGATPRAAEQAADLYAHTVAVIRDADAMDGYEALGEADLFDMEYWSLEQAKLGKHTPRPLDSQVVVITGAASGIGLATAQAMANAGATVHGIDIDPRVDARLASVATSTDAIDVRDREAVFQSIKACVERYGGIDGIVSNAGTAPQSPIAQCPPSLLQQSLSINLLSHQWLAQASTEVLRAQGRGGWLLFNASKAAFNPGVGFGPYAVAKAALVALMKQYALEGAPDGIRSNAINADRIRTGLLDESDVEARAAARGLAPDAYFRANLLGREVTADDVAQAFVALATARATTGAVLPVDGGNIAAAPR